MRGKNNTCLVSCENAMAGERPMCNNLSTYYALSPDKKMRYLESPESKCLFDGLPKGIGDILRNGFLHGKQHHEMKDWHKVVEYFCNNSRTIPALIKNPGTYTMLEKMYHFEPVKGVIDNYFLQSIAGGQALKYRYDIVNKKAVEHLKEMLKNRGVDLVIDIGSGPGRNIIDIVKANRKAFCEIKFDCIDIDQDALHLGFNLAKENKLTNIEFLEESMTDLQKRYPANVDYGLLIGILCSLTFVEKVGLLRRLKRYFKPGGKLVSAALTVAMAEKDFLNTYIMREVVGWGLQYPNFGELEKAYVKAGWKYEGCFQEEPTRLYEIGIGVA